MQVDLFDFTLPESLIATQPMQPRGAAKLLHISDNRDGHSAPFHDQHVRDLPNLLQKDDILLYNDCKVLPARMAANNQKGQALSITFLEEIGDVSPLIHPPFIIWRSFIKPGKRVHEHDNITLQGGLMANIVKKHDDGMVDLQLAIKATDFFNYLEKYGDMPLPPYIEKRRKTIKQAVKQAQDKDNYQTIFAKNQGAVAAPTAGLHIDEALRKAIEDKGVKLYPVTLLVGAGTFLPVKVENIQDHHMHSEWGNIPASTAKAIRQQKQAGKRVVALGTTSLRILEAAAKQYSASHIQAFSGKTDIFITPGYSFQLVDCLITNFHLPKSTLFMLVCAFCGIDRMQAAYRHAIAHQYRFFSYGDACFLERSN